MSSVEKRFYAVASGTLGTMRLTGQMFSMGIAMLILSLHIGHTQIHAGILPRVFLRSMKVAFVFFAILCCRGGLCLIGERQSSIGTQGERWSDANRGLLLPRYCFRLLSDILF